MSYALKDEEEARLGEAGSGSLQNENSVQSFGTNRIASGDVGASSLFLARALDSGLGSENEKVKIRDLCAAAVGNAPELVEEINVILAQAEKMFGADDLSCLCSVIGETFVGKIVAGIPEQLGILEFPANDNLGRSLYRGQFDEGRRDGLGVLRWGDGTIYEGEFRRDRPRGYGVETYADGGVYSGQFVDDSRCGFGVYAFADGRTFAGAWVDGMPHGEGIETVLRPDGEAIEVLARYEEGELTAMEPISEENQDRSSKLFADLDEILSHSEARAKGARAEDIKASVITLLSEELNRLIPSGFSSWERLMVRHAGALGKKVTTVEMTESETTESLQTSLAEASLPDNMSGVTKGLVEQEGSLDSLNSGGALSPQKSLREMSMTSQGSKRNLRRHSLKEESIIAPLRIDETVQKPPTAPADGKHSSLPNAQELKEKMGVSPGVQSPVAISRQPSGAHQKAQDSLKDITDARPRTAPGVRPNSSGKSTADNVVPSEQVRQVAMELTDATSSPSEASSPTSSQYTQSVATSDPTTSNPTSSVGVTPQASGENYLRIDDGEESSNATSNATSSFDDSVSFGSGATSSLADDASIAGGAAGHSVMLEHSLDSIAEGAREDRPSTAEIQEEQEMAARKQLEESRKPARAGEGGIARMEAVAANIADGGTGDIGGIFLEEGPGSPATTERRAAARAAAEEERVRLGQAGAVSAMERAAAARLQEEKAACEEPADDVQGGAADLGVGAGEPDRGGIEAVEQGAAEIETQAPEVGEAGRTDSEAAYKEEIQATAEKYGRTESKDARWMAEIEAQVAALQAANDAMGIEASRTASEEAYQQKIQETAERYGRTESKDARWMAEIEAQVAALQAANDAMGEPSRTASEAAYQEKIQETAEKYGRTESKDARWMAEIEAQVAAIQAGQAAVPSGGSSRNGSLKSSFKDNISENPSRTASEVVHKQQIQETAERYGRTESKDARWMAEIEAQVAAMRAANDAMGEPSRTASEAAYQEKIQEKIQELAENYGRTESKDARWMAEIEAQVAAIQAGQAAVPSGGSFKNAHRADSEAAYKEQIQATAEKNGRTESKDARWMAEIDAQVAALQAKMMAEAVSPEIRSRSRRSSLTESPGGWKGSFKGDSPGGRRGSLTGSSKKGNLGTGIHSEFKQKREQHEQELEALSRWARENRASSVLTDYRGRLSSTDNTSHVSHEDASIGATASFDSAVSDDVMGHISATDAEANDFGMSDSLDVVPSAVGDLPDLEHTIFLVREESEAEKRPWSPSRQAHDSSDGQSESSNASPLPALRPSTAASQMTPDMGSLRIFSENRSAGSGISDGNQQPRVTSILEDDGGNEGDEEKALGEFDAEGEKANAELSRVLGEGGSLMAALGEEKSGEVLRGEFKGYETGVEVAGAKAQDSAENDGQGAVEIMSTPAPKSGADAGSEDRRSESAKKLARLVEEGETLVSAIPEESAAALLEALQEGNELAASLYAEMLASRPVSPMLEDPAGLKGALSPRTRLELKGLVQGGKALLSALPEEEVMSLLKALKENTAQSPLASVLLYEGLRRGWVDDGEEGDDRPLSPGTRQAVGDLVREGSTLLSQLGGHEAEGVLDTLLGVSSTAEGDTPFAAIVAEHVQEEEEAAAAEEDQDPRRLIRGLSARTRGKVLELVEQGHQLLQVLGEAEGDELIATLRVMSGESPLASLLGHEAAMSMHRVEYSKSADTEAMRRALSARRRAAAEKAVAEGEKALGRVVEDEEGLPADARGTMADMIKLDALSETAASSRPVSGRSRPASGRSRPASGSRARLLELLEEGRKYIRTPGALDTLRSHAQTNAMATVLYNELVRSHGAEASAEQDPEKLRARLTGDVKNMIAEGEEMIKKLTPSDGGEEEEREDISQEAPNEGSTEEKCDGVDPAVSEWEARGGDEFKSEEGQQGKVGPDADVGEAGPDADVGEAGPDADVGEAGPDADVGEAGPDADVGEVGPDADVGEVGPDADVGEAGPDADVGEAGPDADVGEAGPDADVGEAGPDADVGEVGPDADVGEVGPGADVGASKESVDTGVEEGAERLGSKQERAKSDADKWAAEIEEAARVAREEYLAKKKVEDEIEAKRKAEARRIAEEQAEARRLEDARRQAEAEAEAMRIAELEAEASRLRSGVELDAATKDDPEAREKALEAAKAAAAAKILLALKRHSSPILVRSRPGAARKVARKKVPGVRPGRYAGGRHKHGPLKSRMRMIRSILLNACPRAQQWQQWTQQGPVEQKRQLQMGLKINVRVRMSAVKLKNKRLHRQKQHALALKDDSIDLRALHGTNLRGGSLIRRLVAEFGAQGVNPVYFFPSMQVSAAPTVIPKGRKRLAKTRGLQSKSASAKRIQDAVRAHNARGVFCRRAISAERRIAAVYVLQKWMRHTLVIMRAQEARKQRKLEQRSEDAALAIQGAFRGHNARLEVRYWTRRSADFVNEEIHKSCSIRIQTALRAKFARSRFAKVERESKMLTREQIKQQSAATNIQCAVRCLWARRKNEAVNYQFCRKIADKFATKVQCAYRCHLARGASVKLNRVLSILEGWGAGFAWRRTMEDLVRIASRDWGLIMAVASKQVGPRMAFTRSQAIAPAILPNWWVGHFPVRYSSRVNLKSEVFQELEEQLRKDRIHSLGGVRDFSASMRMITRLVGEVSQVHVVSLGLTTAYDTLVSLMVFCNIHGSNLAASGDERSQKAGLDLLKYAETLSDGPTLSLPGMVEKMQYKLWTHSNLSRLYYMRGDFTRAADHARVMMAIKVGEPAREELMSVFGHMYLGLIQSKMGRHTTAAATLEKTLENLSAWYDKYPAIRDVPEGTLDAGGFQTFCWSKDTSRLYYCTPAHLAAVCTYNLSVEQAACNMMEESLMSGRRAVALSIKEVHRDAVFFRRSRKTLIALEQISVTDQTFAVNHAETKKVEARRMSMLPFNEGFGTAESKSQRWKPGMAREASTSSSSGGIKESAASQPSAGDDERPNSKGSSIGAVSLGSTVASPPKPISAGNLSPTPAVPGNVSSPLPARGSPKPDAMFDPRLSPRPNQSPVKAAAEAEEESGVFSKTNVERFGMWFGPAIAMQNDSLTDNGESQQPQHVQEELQNIESITSRLDLAGVQDQRADGKTWGSSPSIFVRFSAETAAVTRQPLLPAKKSSLPPMFTPASDIMSALFEEEGEDEDVASMPPLLLIAALPLSKHDCLELTTRQGQHMHWMMRSDNGGRNGINELNAIKKACGDVLNGPAKLKNIHSASTRAFVRDIIILALQAALTRCALAHEGFGQGNFRTADQLIVLVDSLVMSGLPGKDEEGGPDSHQALMGTLASLIRTLVLAGQHRYGDAEKEIAAAIPLATDEAKIVLHLNRSAILCKEGRHKEGFQSARDAHNILADFDEADELFCYSPSHSESELTRQPLHQFSAFSKFMCSVESLFLGFEGPALRFAKDGVYILSTNDSPRQMYPQCKLLAEVVTRMELYAAQCLSRGVSPQISMSGTDKSGPAVPAPAARPPKVSSKKATQNGTPKKLPKIKGGTTAKPVKLTVR